MLLMSNKAASQAASLRIDIKPTSTSTAGEITDKTTKKKNLQVTGFSCLRLDCESGEKFIVYEDKLNTVVINGRGLYHEAVLYQNDCAKVNYCGCRAVCILSYA